METKDNILIWIDEITDTERKDALPGLVRRNKAGAVVSKSAEEIRMNIQNYINKFAPLLKNPDTPDSSYIVDEIELALTVNAEGGIELLGKLTIGAEASVKVRLKRRNN
jgi:hypothetical protein